jgi:hypothetical protein
MLIAKLQYTLHLSNFRNYSFAEDLVQRIQLTSILSWKMDILVLALTLKNKGRGGTLLLTSLIRRLSAMPLLKAEYASSVGWVLITVS